MHGLNTTVPCLSAAVAGRRATRPAHAQTHSRLAARSSSLSSRSCVAKRHASAALCVSGANAATRARSSESSGTASADTKPWDAHRRLMGRCWRRDAGKHATPRGTRTHLEIRQRPLRVVYLLRCDERRRVAASSEQRATPSAEHTMRERRSGGSTRVPNTAATAALACAHRPARRTAPTLRRTTRPARGVYQMTPPSLTHTHTATVVPGLVPAPGGSRPASRFCRHPPATHTK